MPTILPNRAEIVYNYGTASDTATSNLTNTTLLDQYTMTVSKTAVDTEIRPGSDAVYVIRVENNGSGALYNVTATDNLGGAVNALSYVEGSAQFYLNGDLISGTASSAANEVVFSIATPLQAGDNLLVVYAATVSESAAETVFNTVTVEANSGSDTGATISQTDSEAINITSFASLAIVKTADKDTVVSGDTLTYTFTIVNSGNSAVDSLTFTDALPAEFTVTDVSYTVNGITTTLTTDDYEILPPNTINIPNATSSVVLGVPAADSEGPGVATIVISGIIA